MDRRHLPAVTVTALMVLVALGATVGWRAATAPLPEEDRAATPAELCVSSIAVGDRVDADRVRVSIYNAGSRAGLAGTTLDGLTERGFLPGEVGNAPDELDGVRFVRVLAPSTLDPAARLVAQQFGPQTLVQQRSEDLGPGVDVVVGDDFVGMVAAETSLEAEMEGSGC